MGPFPPFERISNMILTAAMTPETTGSLEDTVAQLRRGDASAITAILSRYRHRLYRYLLRIVKESSIAEDLFQQTFLQLMLKIHRYDERRSFEVWMFSVARHLAIDHLRRMRESSLDAPDEFGHRMIDAVAVDGADALEQLLEYERGVQLAAAVSELPVIHREVLMLRFEEDMKLEEIAEIAGIPLSTVKSRLSRALENLRFALRNRKL
jgi:RNA polymerase sigma-70 factor (ECF subfamily)